MRTRVSPPHTHDHHHHGSGSARHRGDFSCQRRASASSSVSMSNSHSSSRLGGIVAAMGAMGQQPPPRTGLNPGVQLHPAA